MDAIVDRRQQPSGSNLGNRQRFLRRARSHIRRAVKENLKDRGVTDAEQGGSVSIPRDEVHEPELVQDRNAGAREHVLPGNREFVEGDRIQRPESASGGGGQEGSATGEGEDDFTFELSRDEFLDVFFEDLELPDLVKARVAQEWSSEPQRAGFTTDGPPARLNLERTMRRSMARRVALGRPTARAVEAMEQELEWPRANPKGRQSKNKARLQRIEEMQQSEYQKRAETNEIYIPPGTRLGDKVVEAQGLSKQFRDRELYQGMSCRVPPGGIVGVIGPNGAGKTTLLRMITGAEQPDAGTIELGDTVDVAYVDQSRDSLNGEKTVWEEISDGHDYIEVGNWQVASRAYVGRFNFKGPDQQKKVKDLSGGERNRVHLAKLLKSGGNLLLLDEPTNDLDVETLRALEQALLDFPGSAVVISHDRWFLDRISTHTLAFEETGEVFFFEGSYSEYEEDRKRRLGADADQPHRAKHKRLDR